MKQMSYSRVIWEAKKESSLSRSGMKRKGWWKVNTGKNNEGWMKVLILEVGQGELSEKKK